MSDSLSVFFGHDIVLWLKIGGSLLAIALFVFAVYYWRTQLRALLLRSTGLARTFFAWARERYSWRKPAKKRKTASSAGELSLVMKACIALVCVAYLMLAVLAVVWVRDPTFWSIVASALGLIAFLLAVPFIPGAVASLANKPNRFRPVNAPQALTTRDYPKSQFGFFTKVYPGQVKMIERGGRFIRGVMAYDHHMFLGERGDNRWTPVHSEYWKVVKTKSPFVDSHPIPFPAPKHPSGWLACAPVSLLWWAYKRLVYRETGYIFTGFPPFQGVKTYPMERFKRMTNNSGKVDLVRIEDWSDHYRVAHFQYPVLIADVDTQDKIPVKVLLNEIGHVLNPHMVAYKTDDDWPTRFLGSISNATTSFTRPRPLDQVLTSTDSTKAMEMAKTISKLAQASVKKFGIALDETQILDISPMDPETDKKLGDLAIARVDRAAAEERAQGNAAPIRASGEALKAYPEALPIAQIEGLVRAAKAAGEGNGIVILGGTQSVDSGQAALIQEIRRLAPQPATST